MEGLEDVRYKIRQVHRRLAHREAAHHGGLPAAIPSTPIHETGTQNHNRRVSERLKIRWGFSPLGKEKTYHSPGTTREVDVGYVQQWTPVSEAAASMVQDLFNPRVVDA